MEILKPYSSQMLVLICLFLALPATSQNPIQPEPSPELEAAAKEAAEYWEDELSLSVKQTNLMERTFIEYTMRRNEVINSGLPEEEKTQTLEEIQVLEDGDIRNVLTKPQYEQYLRVRSVRGNAQNPAVRDTTN